MDIDNLLSDKRSHIIKKWRNAIITSYPKDSQTFLRREKSQFANPVGNIIAQEIETLYDEVIKGENREKISSCLDTIIRVRAVQDFTPSQAVAFVLQLKRIIREELGNGHSPELLMLDSKIDDVVLLAFDVYSKCRQEIYEIRVREVKNQVGKLLERANLIVEIPEGAPELRDDNARTVL
ncbi:MAG: RsbRD N-terminal domain-containing protein [Deltaproteobacteria bacterium]|nr:RsbRD N-terminal domain-containing protein [Deltaproteobacteria bacterium]